MGRKNNRKKHKNRKKIRNKKKQNKNNKKQNKKNSEQISVNYKVLLEQIEKITDEFGRTVRNITLIIKRKEKPIKIPKIKQNIARQRISNFRTGQYKKELLKKFHSINIKNN
jgi:hypothetical protein